MEVKIWIKTKTKNVWKTTTIRLTEKQLRDIGLELGDEMVRMTSPDVH